CDRFHVWPARDPVALLYSGPSGTLIPAGDPVGGPPLCEAAERVGWRVLVGDARIGQALLEALPRGVFRRRPGVREQRFMAVEANEVRDPDRAPPPGFRPARLADLDTLVEFACLLHVEDHMGPPIARSARGSVQARLRETIERGETFVMDRDGRPVGKADLSLRSHRRGAQIAGVYVDKSTRGQGVASALVGALVRMLVREGLPGISLHVRADNERAMAAYRRAGLCDRGPWILALR
ncbi:MAG: GNAT family N-acetyltransferase, partial [Nitriliruptorales bacterium]|nr:GNAT family N-acetyltransferase [Nitriliruptorales bacterium]